MKHFPLGGMARSGFTHMAAAAAIPDFFTVRRINAQLLIFQQRA